MDTILPPTTDGKRLLLLGDARQTHITRWAEYFGHSGYEVITISLEENQSFAGTIITPTAPAVLPDLIRYPYAVRQVKRVIGRFEPDIINAHFLPNYGMIAAMIDRRPWILSTWGSDIMLLPQRSPFHLWRTTYVLKRASFITSDARIMSNKLIEYGCDAGRILTVPFGVDQHRFHPAEPVPGRPGPRLLSNRKLEPVYNIETVIDALAPLSARFADARLSIVGSGSLKKDLLDRAHASPAAGAITFIPDVVHSKVADVLRDHDIYISMSLSDTTSVSLLEAMACGIFPVVSDIPANREWIKDGTNGYLVPVRDPEALATAVSRAWDAPAFMRSAGEANVRIIAERANWFENMERVAQLFDRAIQERA